VIGPGCGSPWPPVRLDFAPPMFTFKDPDDNLLVLIEDEVEH
jgi:hypothetical protein